MIETKAYWENAVIQVLIRIQTTVHTAVFCIQSQPWKSLTWKDSIWSEFRKSEFLWRKVPTFLVRRPAKSHQKSSFFPLCLSPSFFWLTNIYVIFPSNVIRNQENSVLHSILYIFVQRVENWYCLKDDWMYVMLGKR